MKRPISAAGGRRQRGGRQEYKRGIQSPFRDLLAQPRAPVGAEAQVEPRKGGLQLLDGFAQHEIGDSLRHA